jgi:extracellular factor (EF) 3-hydroxypalmitic acid methyl ester biosynthesis protein
VSRNSLQYLTPNDWLLIASRSKRVVFRLGEEIIRFGEAGSTFFIIRRGSVAVELPNVRSVDLVLEKDDVCGEMAFLERGQSTASVVAKDVEVEADAIQAIDLRLLCETFPGFAGRFYHSVGVILARRLRDTSRELVQAINTKRL